MSKPETINIMGKEIKINYKNMKDLHGEFNLDKNCIDVSNKLKGKELTDTILHEAFHACLGYSGLNELLTSEIEEALARMVEYNYIAVVRSFEGE